ncbi:extracellular solute-binding protein [Solihabitans fulvus]|uniref:Probable sugar-binding periplasmic protein n=1 Tax=Solihabitans fulvus TaxID=1892852 RepID=A0A5B2XI30_9PSEU|nr:extracellular solute-binding protein [Solihabitans fulvus]KAA2262382.1 extracellular solute-binding protein [Solihabitans fulvus]
MRARLRPALILVAAGVLATAACTAGGGGSTEPAAAPDSSKPVTVTVWSNFADRELGVLKSTLDAYHGKHVNVTIDNQGSQDDDKITQAIRGGNPPDVAISFTTDNIGQFCSQGSWQDLQPYIDRDKVNLDDIPQAVRDYTQFNGKRCSLPMLADVYGLYYNKDLFAAAGISSPPKSTDEMLEDAKKLTVKNPDGSIKVAGFLPQWAFYAYKPQIVAPSFGAQWLDKDGKSGLGKDQGWQDLFGWQKKLVDFYGQDNLQKFTAGLGQEYSADMGFQAGKVAMAIDGEFRTAFIADQVPTLNYGTAPAPTSRPELYGGGYTTGTIIGIPKGAKNPGAAWDLIKYLATDTDALVTLANGLHNVPSTKSSLSSPNLKLGDQFKPFLDIFANKNLASNPASTIGDQYLKFVSDFGTSWENGQVTDLPGGLAKLDKQIDDAKALGGK